MQQFNLTINNRQLTASADQTILDVALANGIEIPNLCHDPRLEPTGACRMCLVEVEGQRAPVTACTFEVADNMVIRTDTEQLRSLRKSVLELLFY